MATHQLQANVYPVQKQFSREYTRGDLNEFSDALFFLVWKQSHCQKRKLSYNDLFDYLVDLYNAKMIETIPFIEVFHSWIAVVTAFGFLRIKSYQNVRCVELTATGVDYVENYVVQRSFAMKVVDYQLKEKYSAVV